MLWEEKKNDKQHIHWWWKPLKWKTYINSTHKNPSTMLVLLLLILYNPNNWESLNSPNTIEKRIEQNLNNSSGVQYIHEIFVNTNLLRLSLANRILLFIFSTSIFLKFSTCDTCVLKLKLVYSNLPVRNNFECNAFPFELKNKIWKSSVYC